MRSTRVALVLIVVLGGGRVHGAHAQTPYCKPLDATGQYLLAKAQRHATEVGDSAYRTRAWRIPLLTPADVAYVTDESVCDSAAHAYDRELTPETPSVNRGVYVIRLGTWYLVVDSASTAGEWMRGIILDNTYARYSDGLLL